jgi:hypothetical protein
MLAHKSNGRRIVDLMVQSATVALFHSHGIALAPALATDEVADVLGARMRGVIWFRATGFEGTLMLCISEEVLSRIGHESLGLHAQHDLVRELTNQLMGRVKNKLLQFQVTLDVGVANTTGRRSPGAGAGAIRDQQLMYEFRARNGQVVVLLGGNFDERALIFSSAIDTFNEGDVVLF